MSDIDDLKYNFGCASCGYKRVSDDRPRGRIPVERIIEKLDACFAQNDMPAAGKLLEYWQSEAQSLNDRSGELSVVNEMLGFYRKVQDSEKGLAAVSRAGWLIDSMGCSEDVPTATIFLNMATTLKAFGRPDEALPLYKKCFATYNACLDENDRLFGGFYNNYGLCQQDLGMYEDAKMSFLFAARIMLGHENGKGDAAISYVNLAHCYEAWVAISENDDHAGSPQDNTDHTDSALDAMKKAYELLCAEDLRHDGELAYTLSKCWPSFEHFGLTKEAQTLKAEAQRLYGGN